MAIDSCPTPTAPITGVVRFEPAEFKAAYPMFATVADSTLRLYFFYATLLLNNSCASLVCDAQTRETLLYLLTAHITALFSGVGGQPPSGVVGRVDTAHEGTVSVGLDMGVTSQAQAWYLQTQWGAMYWNMTGRFRRFMYVAPEPTCADLAALGPLGYYPGQGGGNGGCGC